MTEHRSNDLEKRAEIERLREKGFTLAEAGRAVGVTRQRAHQLVGHKVNDQRGRYERIDREVRSATAKLDAGQSLTRDERHLLQREYRRREREALAE